MKNSKKAKQSVEVELTPEMARDLSRVALRRGVKSKDVIKIWLADKLDEHARKAS